MFIINCCRLILTMPARKPSDVVCCPHCPITVRRDGLSHNVRRCHASSTSLRAESAQLQSMPIPTFDEVRSLQLEPSTGSSGGFDILTTVVNVADLEPPSELIREATIAVLRRFHAYSKSDLMGYLANYFPDIPDYLRSTLVIAASSAAQYAAAMFHLFEDNIDSDDPLMIRDATSARSMLSRWAFGLRIDTPGTPMRSNTEQSFAQERLVSAQKESPPRLFPTCSTAVAVTDEQSEAANRGIQVSSGPSVDVPHSAVVAVTDEQGESASRGVLVSSGPDVDVPRSSVVAVVDGDGESASRGILVSSGPNVDVPRSAVVAVTGGQGESASRDVSHVSNIGVTTSQTTVVTVPSPSTVKKTENLFLSRQFPVPLPSPVVVKQPLCVTDDVSDTPLKVHASPAPSIEEDAETDDENVEPGHGLRGEAKHVAQTSRSSSKPVSRRRTSPSRRPLSFNQCNVISRSSNSLAGKRHRSPGDAGRRDDTTDRRASDRAMPCRPCSTSGAYESPHRRHRKVITMEDYRRRRRYVNGPSFRR